MNCGGFQPDDPLPGSPSSSLEVESSSVLLRRVRNGDRQALDSLCHRYLPILRKWASHRLPPWARDLLDTDDIVQDTFLRTLKHVKEFEPRRRGAFHAYLRQAVRHGILNEMRRLQAAPPRDPLQTDREDLRPSPLEEAVGREVLGRYEVALGRLRGEEREAIVARIEMELSYEEVADALGKPTPDAARVAIGRALVRLAQEMKRGRTG